MKRLRAGILLLLCLMASTLAKEPTVVASPSPSPTLSASPESSLPQPSFLPFTVTKDKTRASVLGPMSGQELLMLTDAEGFDAESRAALVSGRLQSVIQNQGETPALVTSQVFESFVVLMADDIVLVTVTPEDVGVSDPRALAPGELRRLEIGVAEDWRMIFQTELGYAAWIRSPGYLEFAIPLVLIVIVISGLLHFLTAWINKRYPIFPMRSLRVLLWTLVTIFALWMFPRTKWLAWLVEERFLWPFLKFGLLVVGASLLSEVLERLVIGYFDDLIASPLMRPRRAQRFQTLCSVVRNSVKVVVFVIAAGIALSLLPINYAPLLTSAGVLGVAIGLAGQDFLKDIIAGVFILVEDRFGVGDWIEWDTYSGSVESVNLRSTRLRTIEGGLITVPNSDLRVVINQSNEWAQVDFKIGISYNADLELALRVLEEEAKLLAKDWSDRILEPPTPKGVHELADSAIVLRIYFKTLPLQQWDVQREFNRRMKLRLDREGIEIPFPQTSVWIRSQPQPQEPKEKDS